MLKRRAPLAFIVTFLLVSCHHDDNTPQTTCFPAQFVSVTHIPGGQTTTSTTTFKYDDKMNLVEIQDDLGSLTFMYTGGQITSTKSTSSQIEETWSYNSAGLLSHVNGNSSMGSFVTYSYTEDYSYNSAGELITIEWNYTKPNTSAIEQTFVSNNGNEIYEVFLLNDHDVVDSVNFSGYDSKRNPYASIAQTLGKQKFYFLASVTRALAVSKNNATVIFSDTKSTVRYEYNSNSYPTKVTTTSENGNVTESTITYTNCQ